MTDVAVHAPRYGAAFPVLFALSFCHLVNDMMQSLMMALYPSLKDDFTLSFTQIGLLTFVFQATASVLQPLIGLATDRRPQPYSLPVGMAFTCTGILILAVADGYALLLVAAALVGTGSAVFHPESSRLARLASGGRHGLAQSLFQVGGNLGAALGPLAAALVVLARGHDSVAWFALVALLGIVVLAAVGGWYRRQGAARQKSAGGLQQPHGLSRRQVRTAIAILLALVLSKYLYTTSLHNYFTFYLIDRFGLTVPEAQLNLFLFLGGVAVGTFAGGPIGDRFGRKFVIWFSILGALPFTLALPFAGLFWTSVLAVVIGVVIASAFSAIVVFAQELLPGRVGMVAGLFFGLAFGVAGIGAAALGQLADATSIGFVYRVCAFLPALGLLAAFLPDLAGRRRAAARAAA